MKKFLLKILGLQDEVTAIRAEVAALTALADDFKKDLGNLVQVSATISLEMGAGGEWMSNDKGVWDFEDHEVYNIYREASGFL